MVLVKYHLRKDSRINAGRQFRNASTRLFAWLSGLVEFGGGNTVALTSNASILFIILKYWQCGFDIFGNTQVIRLRTGEKRYFLAP